MAYSLETVIAEKLHAMIALSLVNSRMKDFFDVYCILVTDRVDKPLGYIRKLRNWLSRESSAVHRGFLYSKRPPSILERLSTKNKILRDVGFPNRWHTDKKKIISILGNHEISTYGISQISIDESRKNE
jgi:hypothetical protein